MARPDANAAISTAFQIRDDRPPTGRLAIPIRRKGVLDDRLIRLPRPRRRRLRPQASRYRRPPAPVLQVQVPVTLNAPTRPSNEAAATARDVVRSTLRQTSPTVPVDT